MDDEMLASGVCEHCGAAFEEWELAGKDEEGDEEEEEDEDKEDDDGPPKKKKGGR